MKISREDYGTPYVAIFNSSYSIFNSDNTSSDEDDEENFDFNEDGDVELIKVCMSIGNMQEYFYHRKRICIPLLTLPPAQPILQPS